MPVAIWATRPRRKSKAREIILSILRIVFLALAAALLLDLALILLILFFPFQTLNLPAQFLKLLDIPLIVSLAVVELPIGVGIGVFLWRVLGERTLSVIAQADAMIKYDHLKIITGKDKTKYVINARTKKGYLLSPIIRKLAREGIVQTKRPIDEKDTQGAGYSLEKREPTLEELSLA